MSQSWQEIIQSSKSFRTQIRRGVCVWNAMTEVKEGNPASNKWREDSFSTRVWFFPSCIFPGFCFSLHLQPLPGRPRYLQTLSAHTASSSPSSMKATLLKIWWFSSGADNMVIYIPHHITEELVMQTQATDLTNLLEAELMSVFWAKTYFILIF